MKKKMKFNCKLVEDDDNHEPVSFLPIFSRRKRHNNNNDNQMVLGSNANATWRILLEHHI